jgi:light-harvesting protein B-800-850 alpha chain
MNNGRIWCIVSPTVGIPLFLSAAALTSLTVHFAILNNTTWIKSYWQGKAPATAALQTPGQSVAVVDGQGQPAFVINVTPTNPGSATQAGFAVRVEPTKVSTAEASLKPNR